MISAANKNNLSNSVVFRIILMCFICLGYQNILLGETVDVIVHIEEFMVLRNPGDPLLGLDPDVYVIVSINDGGPDWSWANLQQIRTDTTYGADIGSDAGMVCTYFLFKGVQLVDGKIKFHAAVLDDDGGFATDDPMGETPGGYRLIDPSLPINIFSDYVYAKFSITIVGYCTGEQWLADKGLTDYYECPWCKQVKCGRNLPPSVPLGGHIQPSIPVDVNEASPPPSFKYTEQIARSFTYVSSNPPAEVSVNRDGEEMLTTTLTWSFTGAEVYDRTLVYEVIAPDQSGDAYIVGHLTLPGGVTLSNPGPREIRVGEPVPVIPTVSQWGLIAMAGLLVTVGAIVIVRRRRRAAA